ncbi:MAG: hypothetical protein GY725_19395 [bacterium]|nr:hypothetical protein [bacterium]
MSWEPGGYADRLGGRYEDRWAVRQLLLVLAEEVQSVTISPVGPDEQGVDLLATLPDGVREAHQCKGENRDSPKWTMADLANRGVLRNLRFQLERSPQHRFRFVSALPAIELKELTRSARDSRDAESFYHHQIRFR